MNRPAIGLVLVLAASMQIVPKLSAQAVSIVASTESSASTSSSSLLTPSPSSSSAIDFSAMSWRFGRMSPFAQQPISTTSTAQPSVPAPPISTSDNNLFVGSTQGIQGTLDTTGSTGETSTASISTIQPLNDTTSTLPVSSSYVPRFFTVDTHASSIGLIGTIEPTTNDMIISPTQISHNGITGEGFSSVPEPGTLAMCGGLLVLVGYGYSRRRLNAEIKTNEVTEKESESVETDEAAAV